MNDSIIITFTDLKKAFFRHAFALKVIASLSFFFTFVFLVTKEPQFLAETTFQQFAKITNWYKQLPKMYQEFLSYPVKNSGIVMMQSNQVLKPVIQDLGLQMVAREKPWSKWLKNAQKNVLYTCNLPDKNQRNFVFSCVSYEQPEEMPISLQITSANTYQILSREKNLLAEGQIARLVSTPFFSIVVNQFPKVYKLHTPYYFTLIPWEKTAAQLRSKLDIRPSASQKKFLKMYFSSPDGRLSIKVITHIIQFYEKFVHSEMMRLLKVHEKFLKKREEELLKRLDALLIGYASERIAPLKKTEPQEAGLQEQILDIRKELGMRLLQSIVQTAQMQEMKLRSPNLISRDPSAVSLCLSNHYVIGYSFLASCVGLVFGYFCFISRMIIRGIPVSYEGLAAANIHTCGYLSPCCGKPLNQLTSSDLQTLRKICQFISAHKNPEHSLRVSLIIKQHVNYTSSLADLLALRGFKMLIVDCSFEKSLSEPSFVQFLEGSIVELPIRQLEKYDRLPMGHSTYGFEWLVHPKFSATLSRCKQYDLILLTTHASAKKLEAQIFCKIADCVIVTTQTDSKQDLLPYLMLPKKQEISSATFVIIEETSRR